MKRLLPLSGAASILIALAIAFGAGGAAGQANYPDQPVRILVGFTPGVAPDVTGAPARRQVFGKPGASRS